MPSFLLQVLLSCAATEVLSCAATRDVVMLSFAKMMTQICCYKLLLYKCATLSLCFQLLSCASRACLGADPSVLQLRNCALQVCNCDARLAGAAIRDCGSCAVLPTSGFASSQCG
ncbi:hypothetical protein U1Q18_011253 [Sarracenia purpurea var. burkii]